MAIVHELTLDRYAPDGTVRNQGIFIRRLGGTYGFYGAKWLDHDTHAWIEGTSLSKQFSTGRLTADDEIAANSAVVHHTVAMGYTMQGMAKFINEEGRQDCMFVDTAPTPNDVYLVRIPADSSPFEMNIATGPTTFPPAWGPCWCDRDFAYIGSANTTNNLINIMRLEGTGFVNIRTLLARTHFTNFICRGIAYNGRDIAVVSQDSTVSPPGSYRVDVGRLPVTSGAIHSTWTRTYGGGDLVEAVDIDWDGREWLVYWTRLFDTGA